MSAPADRPGVLVFPPALYFGTLLVAFVLQLLWPIAMPVPFLGRLLGAFVAVAGVALSAAGRRAFTRAGTEVNPLKGASSSVVETGPFRRTRNPMYAGMTLAYLGLMLAGQIGWMLVFLLPVVVLMHWGVVLREERYLSGKFGAPYDEYRKRVRRYF